MKYLLLLLPLIAIFAPCIVCNAIELVYDSVGKELSNENEYYIFPVGHKFGGGALTIMYAENTRCEHFVSHKNEEALQGTKLSSTSKLQYVVANADIDPNYPASAKVFRIERYSDDIKMGYKILSCSTLGEHCKNLGFHGMKDRMLLVETDEPLAVHFNKVK
ncbi:trypsin inhibitor BvTI-like [Oryza brachyantha]|uniref:Uncharacterized protein n=1 Tax=Oryza brachyantha TaxID=4533 RepID=J3LF46_ORYBR|nr:trypsin inhibitor BvTI-like [Oryza brachyantha]